MLTFLLICLWSCLHDRKRHLNSWSICQNNANWHFFTFSPGANDVFIVVVFCGVLFFSDCSFDFFGGFLSLAVLSYTWRVTVVRQFVENKKKKKRRKWRLVRNYLPGWTTSTHSFHRGESWIQPSVAICQCVDIGQTKQRSAERVRFRPRGNQQKRKGERESLRHIWVALIIQVKLYLTFFFKKIKKKRILFGGDSTCASSCVQSFYLLLSFQKREKKNETGGSRKQRHGPRICFVTWSRLLTILSASFS